jgi:hypothetical protein
MKTIKNELFDFLESKKIGDSGEELFLSYLSDKIEKADGYKFDFITKADKKTIELKTDMYDPKSTSNFFIERYSDIVLKKDGGPWRALKDNVNFYVYFYPMAMEYYTFNPKTLVSVVDALPKKKEIMINNKGFTTMGYLINRNFIKQYYIKKQFPVFTEK